jgi:putative membrane protein
MILKYVLYLIQGALVGIGAILPGVSGGVMCVAFGVYEPMMALMTHPRRTWRKHIGMFLPFAIGWVLGFILLAKAIELLFASYTTIALMLFFGLIGGTLPELLRSSQTRDPDSSWTPFVLSLSLAYLFFHLLENATGMTDPISFASCLFCGVLWGLSLIVPGFTSSSILIALGLYEPMTAGIGSLDPAVLIPMLLGIGVTALSLARVVSRLFERHYAATLRVVLGFVIASALGILPDTLGDPLTAVLSLACFAIGFAVARGIDVAGKGRL